MNSQISTCGGLFSRCCMLMCLISAVLLFVEEVRFIVPVLKVNYGGPQSARVKLMNRVKLLSRSVKAEGDTNKQP